ncbi:hypothetical protein [Piscinibacter terrae]|uniref:DUF2867 domain-containing protein n=1 Tax=Piscinibacter terrae TaxID=2496871 RepID=A0A3N7HVY0_9BURK|nr:hypothetical protein [Albitalea terrae]RQP25151.1 hypothetical protein DZC73_09895 [Albitalea terrae]
MPLIDRFLPHYQFSERHEIRIRAPAARVLDLACKVDMADDPVVAGLLRLRGMPGRIGAAFGRTPQPDQWRGFGLHNFTPLGRDADREVAFGLIGQFWQSTGGLVPTPTADAFAAFDQPGVAKLVMNFVAHADGHATRLQTRTHVHCPDAATVRRFRPYWLLIRPASGWIRRRALARVKALAESGT